MSSSLKPVVETLYTLNNQGVRLMRQGNSEATKLALVCLKEALDFAAVIHYYPPFSNRNAVIDNIGDIAVCSKIPLAQDELVQAFYFYNKAISLRPLNLLGEDQVEGSILMAIPILLMNKALACYQLAQYYSTRYQIEQATNMVEHSQEYYAKVFRYFCCHDDDSTSKTASFFALVAQNNYSWICLVLGYTVECALVQKEMQHAMDHGVPLPADSRRVLSEFFLNSTLLNMTGYFSYLPAGAA